MTTISRSRLVCASVRFSVNMLATFGEMTARIANVMAARGVAKGDRVGLYLPSTPLMAAGFWACQRLGAIPAPISAMFRHAELRRVVHQTELKALIANAYAAQGVAAEDGKDPYSAVAAYRKAIEWEPANSKARFNLGAIFIEDKHYQQAEAEYRALVEADASDLEAHYWLAASILAQHPPPERVAAACGLLQKALSINDPEKKAQFAKAVSAANCPK